MGEKSINAGSIKERYERFAQYEARGVSPLYEEFSSSVVKSDNAIAFLMTLPEAKQQPNLLLAAVRKACGVARHGKEFCEFLLQNSDEVRSTMLARSTQTNEPARCSTLLPILSRLPQPIALLEVGASAGLCLYPDRYRYAYGEHRLDPVEIADDAPVFSCIASDNTPLPTELPDVVWRSGIDLNPLNIANDDEVEWLETLVWPEQTQRVKNLRRAIATARKDPPDLVKGDLLTALPSLAASAPSAATLVIFHSAVLAYVTESEIRKKFASAVAELEATWISNEHPSVFPEIAARLSTKPAKDQFLLAVDGRPVASTGAHGQSINWFDG